jgi:hypothetical protein
MKSHNSYALCTVVMTLIMQPVILRASTASMDSHLAAECPSAEAWYQREELRRAKVHGHVHASSDAALHDELIAMAKSDEAARTSLLTAGQRPKEKLVENTMRVDSVNLARIKTIIASAGFPTEDKVGKDGIEAAMLIVQHADVDPAFQRDVLKQIQTRAGKDIPSDTYAMLDDRVNLREGKPQHYGSQFRVSNGNVMLAQPSDSPNDISANRQRVGLMPLDDYICIIRAMQTE